MELLALCSYKDSSKQKKIIIKYKHFLKLQISSNTNLSIMYILHYSEHIDKPNESLIIYLNNVFVNVLIHWYWCPSKANKRRR